MDGGWVEPGPDGKPKPFESTAHFLLWLAIGLPVCAVPIVMWLICGWLS